MFDTDFDADFDVSDADDSGGEDVSDSLGDEDIEFLDTSDLEASMIETDDVEDDVYHATRMSDDEVKRIDDMWKDKETDVEPYVATRLSDADEIQGDADDVSDGDIPSPESLEDSFAADVEAMSFDDLNKEQARLAELSQMEDIDIFAEYDVQQASSYDPRLFDALTSGLSKGQLEHLRDGLASGDEKVYEYFGLNDDGDDDPPDELSLTRHR